MVVRALKLFSRYERPRVPGVRFSKPSMTQQHLESETNINQIMERYNQTGLLPVVSGDPLYGDFSDVGDYKSAQETLIKADKAFMALPSKVRDRFDNDPVKLLAFLDNPENLDEAIELGLVERPAQLPSLDVTVPTDTTQEGGGSNNG
jgi:phage internal scaffolding protein